MLTARTQEAEKVLGFELGADDYVTKPYSARELRARSRPTTPLVLFFDNTVNNIISKNNFTNNINFALYLWESSNTTVTGNLISNSSSAGLMGYHSSNTHISGNSIKDVDFGIDISGSNNVFVGNTITNCTYTAIRLINSSDSTINENILTKNYYSIFLSESSYNNISGNIISNNTYSITLKRQIIIVFRDT